MPGFVSSISNSNEAVFANNADFSGSSDPSELNGLQTNGQLWIGSTALNAGGTHVNVNTLTAGAGISITNGAGTITIANSAIPTIDLHVARFIVSAGGSGDGANYTSIGAAITAAVAAGGNQTVFIQPGTYTENLTLAANINLTAFNCDAITPNVTIIGKCTATFAGTSTLSGIRLQTNGDYVLQVTGASATNVNLKSCYINATNANAINCTSTTASIFLITCKGNCSTNTYFITTAGTIKVFYSTLESNNTTVNSTFASAALTLEFTFFACPITTSGTGSVSLFSCEILVLNTTALTHGGSGTSTVINTRFESGTGSAVSIGSTLPMVLCSIFSTNANAITGAGTLLYGIIVFYGVGASSTVNTSTQTALATLI